MSARVGRRRRRQAVMGHTHLARISPHTGCSRPVYHRPALVSIGAAIAKERQKAAREAAARRKKK